MISRLFGDLASELGMVAVGVFATLLAFRVIGKKQGASPSYDEWHRRHGRSMKVYGPLLILIGVGLGVWRVTDNTRPGPPPDWRRYTLGGLCSGEFPEPPKEEKETNSLVLSRGRETITYTLSFTDIPVNTPPATDENWLDRIRDGIAAGVAKAGKKWTLVRDEPTTENKVIGREIEFATEEGNVVRTRAFVFGNRIYRVIAAVPRASRDSDDTKRFLDSFRLPDEKK